MIMMRKLELAGFWKYLLPKPVETGCYYLLDIAIEAQ